jgi:ribose/xylose/arabinose/galactoside ABC-type transport system permease subunit
VRDPLLPHLVLEGFLLLVALVALVLLVVAAPSGARWVSTLGGTAAMVGLMASAFAVSLRTGTPNLAIGALAAMTGLIMVPLAVSAGWPLLVAVVVAVVCATVVAVVLGAVVGLASLPGWAVTFAGALLIEGILGVVTGFQTRNLTPYPRPHLALWFALFLVVSVGGGALWRVPAVRQLLGANRGAPAPDRPRLPALLAGVVGLGVSGLLAALSGVLVTERLATATVAYANANLPLAIGAALLGGTTVYGRRAGIAGTFLAVMALVEIQTYLLLRNAGSGWTEVLGAAAAILGLLVGRGLEWISDLLGRRGTGPAGPPPLPGLTPDGGR